MNERTNTDKPSLSSCRSQKFVIPEKAGDGDSDDGGHERVLPPVLVWHPAEEVGAKQHAQHVEGAVYIPLPVTKRQ